MHRRPFLNIAAYTYLFVMLALLFMPLISRAQNPALSSTPPAGKVLVNVFQTTSGQNVYTYAAGTATATHAPGLDAKMWNDALAVDTYSTLDVGGGVKAPIGTRSVPSKPDTAKAVGNFLRGAGGSALKVAGTVYALADFAYHVNTLCNELGYSCYKGTSPAGSDTVVISKQSSMSTCNVTYVASPYSPTTEFIHTKYCVPSYAGSPTYNYGWSISWGGAGWPGVSFPCGNYTCKTGSGEYALGQTTNASSDPVPSTIEELEASIAAKSGWPAGSALPKVVEQSVASGNPLPLPAPSQLTGPAIIPMAPTITEFPDGSKTTVTPEKRLSFGQTSPTVTVTDGQTTTTTSPTGVTSTVSTGSTPTALPQPVEVKLETCGLPGKPACKIDETGTPTTPTKDGQTELTDGKKLLDDTLTAIKDKTDKDTSWGIVPTWLQSGATCHPVVLMTFPAFLGNKQITLDICPHLDMIYLLMNTLWIVWTFTAVLTMVRGSTTAGAV